MKGTSTPHSFSDNFWSEPSQSYSSSLVSSPKRKQPVAFEEFLSSIDEAPDFYDPYSELNLFLSRKIKEHVDLCGSSKKWSLKIQERLFDQIGPEFQAKFPKYRLGVSALKKTWEKVCYFAHQIEHQKNALDCNGKLNINFIIKENLKHYICLKQSSPLQPYHYAHQVAAKVGECMAAIDGNRPKFDQLTKTIWSVQRNLIHGSSDHKCPYDEYDMIDQLIVKTILEITAKDQQIGHQELESRVTESLQALNELPSFDSLDILHANVSAILADQLYATSPFHTQLFAAQKTAIERFILRHSALCKSSVPAPPLGELVRRIMALYQLSCQLPKGLLQEQIFAGVSALYPKNQPERPPLPQSIFAFISAELVLMRNETYCHSIEHVQSAIWEAYSETATLVSLEHDLLEMVIWKMLSQTEHLLEKLPYRIGQRIEEEIAYFLIDNPSQTFGAIVQSAVQFFKRTKELVQVKKFSCIQRKIHNWVIQGDMLCRWIYCDPESTLLKLIVEIATATPPIEHTLFVSEISQAYLKVYPQMHIYSAQLARRIWSLYKYAWYTLMGSEAESACDRFIEWHLVRLNSQQPDAEPETLLKQLEEIANNAIPLAPLELNGLLSKLVLTGK